MSAICLKKACVHIGGGLKGELTKPEPRMRNLVLLVRPSAVLTVHLPLLLSKLAPVTTVRKAQSFLTPMTLSTWSK